MEANHLCGLLTRLYMEYCLELYQLLRTLFNLVSQSPIVLSLTLLLLEHVGFMVSCLLCP
jgi:hypothetical protein